MSVVRLVAIKAVELSSGDIIKPGESFCLDSREAAKMVDSGVACFNSDFRSVMVSKRKVRVRAAPENMAATTKPQTGIA